MRRRTKHCTVESRCLPGTNAMPLLAGTTHQPSSVAFINYLAMYGEQAFAFASPSNFSSPLPDSLKHITYAQFTTPTPTRRDKTVFSSRVGRCEFDIKLFILSTFKCHLETVIFSSSARLRFLYNALYKLTFTVILSYDVLLR